jgi:hypothetical protein
MRYEIRLAGRLPGNWPDWFGSFTAATDPSGGTSLTGIVADQAALIGLLTAITHMNLTLLLVRRLDAE